MFPLIQIGSLEIPVYFLWNSLAVSGIFVFLHLRAQKLNFDLNLNANNMLFAVIFAFLGARLGHALIEEPQYYLRAPERIFYIWNGGFVYIAGLLSGALALGIWLKIKNENWKIWFDFYTPGVALGYALGRFGCFLTGCCFGTYCSLPWAVTFTGLEGARHPTQLYLMLLELFLFAFVIFVPRKFRLIPGELFALYISLSSLVRMIIEPLRDDFRGAFILGLSPSSFISLCLISMSIGFVTFNRLKKN